MRVVIVGAGIGGLTLALSLHAAGVEAQVHEAVAELKPLGVGINLLHHAVRELTELGLGEALAAYEAARRPATSRIVLANRGNGPEQVMQLAETRAPEGFANAHDVIGPQELAATAGEYRKLAGFDREALNARPSLSVPRPG